MKRGMLLTVKEFYSPFIQEDISRIDGFVDKVTGIRWVDVGAADSFRDEGVHDLFLDGKSVAVMIFNQRRQVIDKICPSCHQMVQWISYDKKFTCFHCEESFYMEHREGMLPLLNIPSKVENGRLFLGLKNNT